jgi:hypothetical protein
MCRCTTCKFTDSFASTSFADWPRGESKGAAKSKAEYAAHWRYCGGSQKPHTLGSPFPCTGTHRTDPRIWYHFPGGQVGQARPSADCGRIDRKGWPDATNITDDYVADFCLANGLT